MRVASQRRVAQLIPIERMTLRYEHYRDPQEALRMRLRDFAGSRVRYGDFGILVIVSLGFLVRALFP